MNYTDEQLESLAAELQNCENPHKLPKDSKLATAIIDNCGALSHNNLQKFTKMLLNELVKRMKIHSNNAKEYWDILRGK